MRLADGSAGCGACRRDWYGPGVAHRGLGFLVIAGVSWGTAGTLGTLLVRASGLSFLGVASLRTLVGGALLLAFLLVIGRFRTPRGWPAVRRVAALAACSAVYQLAYFTAVGLVGVSIATLVTIGSTPVMVAVVDVAMGRHRWDRRLAAALVMAGVGVGLLAGVPPAGLDAGRLVLGSVAALVAGVAFALISLVGARPVAGFADASGTGLALMLAGVAVLPAAAASGPVTVPLTPASVGLVVALGLVPTAAAYLAYLRGLRTESSTTGALVALLEPVTGMVLAAAVLGERLGLAGLVGAALLLGSVAVAAWTSSAAGVVAPEGSVRRSDVGD